MNGLIFDKIINVHPSLIVCVMCDVAWSMMVWGIWVVIQMASWLATWECVCAPPPLLITNHALPSWVPSYTTGELVPTPLTTRLATSLWTVPSYITTPLATRNISTRLTTSLWTVPSYTTGELVPTPLTTRLATSLCTGSSYTTGELVPTPLTTRLATSLWTVPSYTMDNWSPHHSPLDKLPVCEQFPPTSPHHSPLEISPLD